MDMDRWFSLVSYDEYEHKYKTEDAGHLQKYMEQGTCTKSILLPDCRRRLFVTAPATLFTYEKESKYTLDKYICKVCQYLSPEVVMIRIDAEGLLQEVTSNPADVDFFRENTNIRTFGDRPTPLLSDTPLSSWPTLQHSQLVELDRLKINVDVVKVAGESEAPLAVKYILDDYSFLKPIWNEMNIQKALQPHPSILPLDRIVLDDKGHIIGMTTKFIKGAALSSEDIFGMKTKFIKEAGPSSGERTRTIKLKWLKQLTEVLDFIHFDQGIVHGDLDFSRNILIDEESDRLLVLDFAEAKEISDYDIDEELKSVLAGFYHLVTQDVHRGDGRGDRGYDGDFNPKNWEETIDWPVQVELDCDWIEFRDHLEEWLERRRVHPVKAKNQIAVEWQDISHYYPATTRNGMSNVINVDNIDWKRPPYEKAYPDGPQFGGYGSEGMDSRAMMRTLEIIRKRNERNEGSERTSDEEDE
ncbi:hypothetical protein F5Y02DRAFT_367683 [Annulohypoxylon stygium]|nr:hypothetical protein F5Y02DRAFT_367683 [Annulohypoxylon stygium]